MSMVLWGYWYKISRLIISLIHSITSNNIMIIWKIIKILISQIIFFVLFLFFQKILQIIFCNCNIKCINIINLNKFPFYFSLINILNNINNLRIICMYIRVSVKKIFFYVTPQIGSKWRKNEMPVLKMYFP